MGVRWPSRARPLCRCRKPRHLQGAVSRLLGDLLAVHPLPGRWPADQDQRGEPKRTDADRGPYRVLHPLHQRTRSPHRRGKPQPNGAGGYDMAQPLRRCRSAPRGVGPAGDPPHRAGSLCRRRGMDAPPDRAEAAGSSHGTVAARLGVPEKSAAEIEHILGGMWDNIARCLVEYAMLDRLWDHDLGFGRRRPHPGRSGEF